MTSVVLLAILLALPAVGVLVGRRMGADDLIRPMRDYQHQLSALGELTRQPRR